MTGAALPLRDPFLMNCFGTVVDPRACSRVRPQYLSLTMMLRRRARSTLGLNTSKPACAGAQVVCLIKCLKAHGLKARRFKSEVQQGSIDGMAE